MQFSKFFSQIDIERSNKFPFVFLFICYWIDTYYNLGNKVIRRLQFEDSIIEWLTVIFLVLASTFLLKIFLNVRKNKLSKIKKYFFLALSIFFLFWALEEISWGQRIFNFSWSYISENNYQNEINFHNLNIIQPSLHKLYILYCSFVSFLCLIKKKKNNLFLPDKKLFYFFLLPGLYYLVGELILNFPISYQGVKYTYTVLRSNVFVFQEVNEFLMALGAFLYSINLTRKIKHLKYITPHKQTI